MSHTKKAARLTILTEELLSHVLGQVAAQPRLLAPTGEPLALGPSDRELGRGPYIDPNGIR